MGRDESSIEGTVCGMAAKRGWMVRKVSWIGRKGCPDHWFSRNGRQVWIEFKDPDGGLMDMQEIEIAKMRTMGVEVHVVSSIGDGKRILGL